MREIKFRAWYTHRNSFYIFGSEAVRLLLSKPNGSDVVLEQYTGIKDKNGVEIYENDIVRQQMRFTETNGVVFWQEEKARFAINLDGFITTITKPQEMSYEVVGNIHENPEKIKVVGDDGWVGD